MTNILDFDDDPLRTIRGGRFRTFRFPAFIGRGVGDLLAPSLPVNDPAPVAGLRDVFSEGRDRDEDDQAGTEPGDQTRSDINVEDLTDAQLNEALNEISGPPGVGARLASALGRGLMGMAFPGGGFVAGAFQRARRSDLVAEGLKRGNPIARDLNNAAGATGFGGPGFDPGGFDPGPQGRGFGSPDEPEGGFGEEGTPDPNEQGFGGFEDEEVGGDIGAGDTPSDSGQDPEGGFGDEETEGEAGGAGDTPSDSGQDPEGGFGDDLGDEEEEDGDDDDDDEGGGEDDDDDDDDDDEGGGEDDDDDEHQGGFITGPDPSRVGEDVRKTLQEGEFVLPVETVDRVGVGRLREVIAGGGGGTPTPIATNEVAGGSRFNPVPGAGQDSGFTSPAIQGPEIPGQNGGAQIQGETNPNSGLTAQEQAELMVALTPRVMELLGRVFATQGRDFPLGQPPGQGPGVPFKAIPAGPQVSGLRGAFT